LNLDYEKLGLKVGIEIHQQLNTKHKLFCNCLTNLGRDEPKVKFLRRLRPTQSELGQVDPAALFEFHKGRAIIYESDEDTSCLVEMDEEPPHNLNLEAVNVCLQVALMVGSKPVDEIHVMRKIVIDGSNTTGFQRTCVLALGGAVDVDGKKIPIQIIGLEEDAARKMGEEGMNVRYNIDRLCIPLIEVSTAPVIHLPMEAEKVAFAIGRILRATRMVKRGIGTIRQDLNISISGGALTEVKGIQKLELISRVIEYEVQRQLMLLKIRDELKARGANEKDITEDFVEVADIFKQTESRVIRTALAAGGVVLAVKLPKFAGLLKTELQPNVRLGTEMADRAKFWGGVGGIFHTDELPSYGITQREVDELKIRLNAGNQDAVVIVADEKEKAANALKAVVERAREAVLIVPEETRAANPEGTTRYMRPRPGAARMYPETDVPPIPLTPQHIQTIKEKLPPLPEQLISRLMSKHGINKKLAEQLIDSDYMPLFEKLCSNSKIAPSFIASTLTETMKNLERQNIPIENLSDEQILESFKLVDEGKVAKEILPEIFSWLAQKGGKPSEALKGLGIKMFTSEEIERLVEKRINENLQTLKSHPQRAFDHLTKIVMAELRGKAEAKTVIKIVREKIEKLNKN
jgi:glutamyl-tRNA(Gln) amidotransferase subunit E